jgi:hypothetical protein
MYFYGRDKCSNLSIFLKKFLDKNDVMREIGRYAIYPNKPSTISSNLVLAREECGLWGKIVVIG